jgi:GDSL-like lipase/acylhydrolase family protein
MPASPIPRRNEAPTSPPTRRGSVALVSASVAALVLLAAAAELAARLYSPDYLTRARGPHVFSDTYGWAARRGVAATLAGHPVTLNEQGYRGRALSLPRGRGLTRVVVLGDSVAFGLGVADDETFCSRLNARDNGIEVANLAVQGYGPDQELLKLERDGLRLEPDLVVVAHCLANDLAEAMLPVSLYDGRTPKPRFTLQDGRLQLDGSSLVLSPAARTLQRLSDDSHIFNRLAALVPKQRPAAGPHWRERYADALHDEAAALRLNVALVRRMRELCQERGITLVVALFPDRFSYRAKPEIAERFVAALRAEGVPLVDLSARFRERGLRLKDVALDGTGHLSAAGHAIVSSELEQDIVRRRPPAGAARGIEPRHPRPEA